MRESDFTLVFDGGSLGNPGRGYGSFRVRRRGEPWGDVVRLEFGDRVTNNEAEYKSLLAGLDAIAASAPAGASVSVLGDSKLVINHLLGKWKVRADNLRPLYDSARRSLRRFGKVELKWHPRRRSVELLGH